MCNYSICQCTMTCRVGPRSTSYLTYFFSVLDNISCLTIFEKHQYFQTTVIPALQLDRLRWCLSISMKTKTLSFYAHNTALLVLNIQTSWIDFFRFLLSCGALVLLVCWGGSMLSLPWDDCVISELAQGKTGHCFFETGLKSYVHTKLFCVTKW